MSKIEILVTNLNSDQKSKSWSKIKNLIKKSIDQKSIIEILSRKDVLVKKSCSKTEVGVKNKNFGRKFKILFSDGGWNDMVLVKPNGF